MGGGYTVFAILELVALARYAGGIAWSSPAAWVYLAFLIALLPIGLYVWFAHRGTPESPQASTSAS